VISIGLEILVESEAVVTSVDRQLATRGAESKESIAHHNTSSARRPIGAALATNFNAFLASILDAASLILCCIAILRTQIV